MVLSIGRDLRRTFVIVDPLVNLTCIVQVSYSFAAVGVAVKRVRC